MAFSVLSQVLAKFIYVYEVKYSYKYFSTYRINQAEIEACWLYRESSLRKMSYLFEIMTWKIFPS